MEVASIAARRRADYGNAKVVVNNPSPQTPPIRHINMNPHSSSQPPLRAPTRKPAPVAPAPEPAPAPAPRSRLPRRPIGDNSFYRSETIEREAASAARADGAGSKPAVGRGARVAPTAVSAVTPTPSQAGTGSRVTPTTPDRTGRGNTGSVPGKRAGSVPMKKAEGAREAATSSVPRESAKWGIPFSKEEVADLSAWRDVKKPALERKPDGSLAVGFDLSEEIGDPTEPQQFESTRRGGEKK